MAVICLHSSPSHLQAIAPDLAAWEMGGWVRGGVEWGGVGLAICPVYFVRLVHEQNSKAGSRGGWKQSSIFHRENEMRGGEGR